MKDVGERASGDVMSRAIIVWTHGQRRAAGVAGEDIVVGSSRARQTPNMAMGLV